MKILGILLLVIGIIGLTVGGIRYGYRDNVANIGPVHVNVQKHDTIWIPPVLGIVGIAAGAGLLLTGSRK